MKSTLRPKQSGNKLELYLQLIGLYTTNQWPSLMKRLMEFSGSIVIAYLHNRGLRVRWQSPQMRVACPSLSIATTIGVAQIDELARDIITLCSTSFIAFRIPSHRPYGSTHYFGNTGSPSAASVVGSTVVPPLLW